MAPAMVTLPIVTPPMPIVVIVVVIIVVDLKSLIDEEVDQLVAGIPDSVFVLVTLIRVVDRAVVAGVA